ncbi:uncharacterized protein LOC134842966 [Symsagittifera roscoffensis]|uniref:uncharacterized protein LOC134841232 n=1 Tax=Symsagittifera roscoffensis TaxID=84072 RepID=UPI00307B4358
MQSSQRNIKTYSRLFKPKNCKTEGGKYTNSTIRIEHQGKERNFNFLEVFQPDCSQSHIFNTVAVPIIDRCLEGENGSIIAYGYTGTGKTHTIEGSWDNKQSFTEGAGLARRCISTLFQRLAGSSGVEIRLSFVEIWMEQIFDTMLLNTKNKDKSNFQRVNVERLDSTLNKPICQSEENAHVLYTTACLNRTVKSTSHNMRSSRSHGIFTIYIKRRTTSTPDSTGLSVESKLNLVDLAGAERLGDSEGVTAEEAKKINMSLIALGKVIDDLSERKSFINYRDSKLTQMLRDSLGGNSNTALIATMNTDISRKDAALRTCEFAARVSGIKLTVTKNYETNLSKSAIEDMQIQLAKLKAENERLKREVNDLRSNKYPSEMPQKVESVQVEPTLEAPVEKLIAKPVTKKKQPVITSQPVPAKSEKPATVAKKDDSIPPPPPPPEDEPPFEEEFYRVGTSSHGILDRIDSNKALLYEATRSSGKKVAKISILEELIGETQDYIESISWQIDILYRQIWDAERQLHSLYQTKSKLKRDDSDEIIISALQDRERSILNGQGDCALM